MRATYARSVWTLWRRALNEIFRVPAATIPGLLAPTVFLLGLTSVFGNASHLAFYHGANFDLGTGENIPQRLRGGRFDTRDLPRYAVRIERNTVYVATTPDNPDALP